MIANSFYNQMYENKGYNAILIATKMIADI